MFAKRFSSSFSPPLSRLASPPGFYKPVLQRNGGYWKEAYEDRTTEDLRDWSHTNAVFYDEKDGTFVLSARRQDAVYKVTRDGELVWILGNHDNWREP